MAWILKLSDREFNTIMFKMLKTLLEKVDNFQEQMGNVSRGIETLRKSKGNSGNHRHCNRNEECFWWPHQ